MPVDVELRTLKRRQNMLLRAQAVIQVYQAYKVHEGVSDAWIYREHIYPRFLIGKSTFDKYLGLKIERELAIVEQSINNHESNRDQ